jgi:enoyl-CoA hydratase/carnithine racemase
MLHYDAEGGRATITIDDPERMNPLANETMVELVAAVHRATRDSEVRVVVITGAGDRAFSAGGDLSGGFVDSPIVDHAARGALADLFRALRRCGKPTVARVNGHALGGGFGLAAACDITIAVDTATLGTPEINVGLWPMMISAVLMPLVSRKALLEMMLTGRRIRADEAEELGIVNRVVPAAGLDAAVDEVVDALLAQSPAALALGKEAFYAITDLDFDTALDHLHNGLTAIAMTEDAVEGVTAFVEKRTPLWHGR